MEIALDVVNWHQPILIKTKNDLDLKTNDHDLVVLGDHLNGNIVLDVYEANGITKVNKNGIKLKEQKILFGFVVATIKF